MRGVALMVLMLVAACDYEVVVGRNRAPIDAEGGGAPTDDAGAAGGQGGGAVDPDAGALDAGLDDGGAAGASDGGLDDAGMADAGIDDAGIDGGGVDAGPFDAGPPALTLGFTGALVLQQGDIGSWSVRVFNDGGLGAPPATVSVSLPGGLGFISGVGCGDAGSQVVCPLGVLGTFAAATAAFDARPTDAGFGWHNLDATLAAQVSRQPLAVTGFGSVVVPIVPPQFLDVSACFGSNLTSFSMCTPASYVDARIALLVDGGIDTILDGGVTPVVGVWGQSPHQRNLAFRFLNNDGGILNSFAGASVSANCFQGVVNNPMGTPYAGAFQACLP